MLLLRRDEPRRGHRGHGLEGGGGGRGGGGPEEAEAAAEAVEEAEEAGRRRGRAREEAGERLARCFMAKNTFFHRLFYSPDLTLFLFIFLLSLYFCLFGTARVPLKAPLADLENKISVEKHYTTVF